MNSTFFPTKTQYFHQFHHHLTQWLRHHGLPTSLHQHSEPFLQQQWKHHIDHIHHTPRFTSRNVTQLQQFLTDKLVLHHDDHELQNLRLFCPQHYFHGCLTTWNTPQLFLPLPQLTAQQLHDTLTQSFPTSIRRAYPWGFRKHFYTPHGVVFLKEILEKRSTSHQLQLFPIHRWHTLASHLQSIRHHALTSSTSTSRPTFHPQPMATPPHPLPRHTSRHPSHRHQR